MAKYYNLDENDVIVTISTDSMEMYQSRLSEANDKYGTYTATDAAIDYVRLTEGIKTDSMKELTYLDKKAIHHLKYYTWIEQQGKTVEELDAQWFDKNYWKNIHALTPNCSSIYKL